MESPQDPITGETLPANESNTDWGADDFNLNPPVSEFNLNPPGSVLSDASTNADTVLPDHVEVANQRLEESLAPSEESEGSGDDNFHVLKACDLSDDSRLFMVEMDDIFALMGEWSIDQKEAAVEVIKVFEENPLLREDTLQVVKQNAIGPREMFSVQVGDWKGVVSKDNNGIVLQSEID